MRSGLAVIHCTLPQGSQPAARHFQADVLIEELLRCCLDVEGLFQLELLGSPGPVDHSGVFSWGGGVSSHVLPWLTSPAFLCSKSLSVPSSLSPAFWLSCQCRPSRSCRGTGIQPWTVSLLEVCPWPWSAWIEGISRIWRLPLSRTLCKPVWCLHWLLRHRGATPVEASTYHCPPVPLLAHRCWIKASG